MGGWDGVKDEETKNEGGGGVGRRRGGKNLEDITFLCLLQPLSVARTNIHSSLNSLFNSELHKRGECGITSVSKRRGSW